MSKAFGAWIGLDKAPIEYSGKELMEKFNDLRALGAKLFEGERPTMITDYSLHQTGFEDIDFPYFMRVEYKVDE